jgi:hypothetical protein
MFDKSYKINLQNICKWYKCEETNGLSDLIATTLSSEIFLLCLFNYLIFYEILNTTTTESAT